MTQEEDRPHYIYADHLQHPQHLLNIHSESTERMNKGISLVYSLQKRWQLGRPTALTIEGEVKLERGHAVLVGLERRDPSHVIWFLLKFNKNSTASNTTGFLLALL